MAKSRFWALFVVLAPLFGYALWLRITSLEGLPEVNGDEVWHAIQLTRMMRGDSFQIFTLTGLPLSPIHAALELPGLLIFNPSLRVVRLPALISGITAVPLLYLLALRFYDRTTALIASSLLAVLPLAIIFSRVSYESSHAPLFGTILLYLSHRLKTVALTAVLAMGYLIHPTNFFVLPVLLAVILARTWEEYPCERARAMKAFIARSALLCTVVLAMGLMTMFRSETQRLSRAYDTGLWGRHDFIEFGAMYQRLLMGVGNYPDSMRSWLFWSVLVVLFGLGLWRLISTRKWDRVLFVGGTVTSVLGLFVFGGTNIIQPGMTRYGLFLVIPTVLSAAFLARALMVVPSTPWRASVLAAQCAGLLAVAWALLLSFDLQRVNRWSYMSPEYRGRGESPLTFRSDTKAPAKAAYSVIVRDLRASGRTGQALVITTEFSQYGPLEWLAISEEPVRFIEFASMPGSLEDRVVAIRDCLLDGGYVVLTPGNGLNTVVDRALPLSTLRRWDIPLDSTSFFTVLRAKREGEPGAPGALASRAENDRSPSTDRGGK